MPSTVVVGGQVLVYGTLTMINGTPIPNATVSIYIGGVYMGGALTNIHGNYSLEFPMPQIYLSRVNVTAIYNPPPGSDYLPSEATTPINVVFNTTSLTINYTREVMWGEPISISGYVSGPPSRSVIISVDGLNITTYTRNNAFSALINTENMTPGNYSIMVYAPPVGPYSPAYAEGLVELNSVVVNVTINTSPLVIAGLPIIVSGVVSPWVGNMSLSLSLGGETILLNLSSPNFTVSMRTSPLLGMGRHQIIVSVSSNPPIMGVTYAYGVFVLNILEVAVPIIIIVALLLVMRSGVISISSEEAGTVGALQPRLGPVRIELGPNAEVKTLREEIAKSVLSGKISIKNVRDIIDALANAVYAVSTKTGVKLRSTDTLREYLRAVRDKLGDEEYAVLEELIRLGEYALYSPHVPSDDEVRRAWELAKRLMQ
ncbi:DUF4129 domain-containing protein [Vulcanisaeta sp. JCM 16161]|uniref:DUF4129 domain-containing protein n=1 Tax=Vulcanisaeta sp. JCM 16161 TaxID=1295372 RepID=UPI000AAD7DBB|nr:DUF4129 domain-containing protein [Vulcanisaeta sp. JCM 16161]